ncbi:YlmH family RNA-binding protein [Domibacillus epiphyticus]|uniref:YlmH family RNA-binding protein n=1 Tax=Domibacillus epiphyticus TaxID=1714355 RepID=UPI0018E9C179|nr:RNA-binding protein [Domibacillus epiphyticus]
MNGIYQHFRPEEKEFIDKVAEWKQQVMEMYAPKMTGFLDPRERQIIRAVVGSDEEVCVSFFGGTADSERQRALIHPDYFEPDAEDYGIILYEINYPDKFSTISHSQILGSIMGLGVKREKFGDIITDGSCFQLFVAKETANYMHMHFDHVGKTPVKLVEKPLQEAIHTIEEWREQSVTVSSTRLDAIIGSLPAMSRQKSQQLIKGGAVKVNWKAVENPSFECAEQDVLSVRGIGRLKILSIDGKTKKEKWRMTLGILK